MSIKNTESNPSRFVTLREVADDLNASRSSTRTWLEAAGIQAFAFGVGRNAAIRFRRQQVEEWLEAMGPELDKLEEGDELEDEELEDEEGEDDDEEEEEDEDELEDDDDEDEELEDEELEEDDELEDKDDEDCEG